MATLVLPIRRNGKYGREAGTQGWEFPFARNPVLLHINQESRAVALRKYTLLFPEPCRIDKNLYINRACDILFLLTTDRDSMYPTWWHEVDSEEEGDNSDGISAADEERWTWDECRMWDMHWRQPGRMSSAFEILCKYAEVTRLALDYSNFYPLNRDVANLKVARETPTELCFVRDWNYDFLIFQVAQRVGQLAKVCCQTLKEIIYIAKGDEMILSGKAIERRADDAQRHTKLDMFLAECLRKRVADGDRYVEGGTVFERSKETMGLEEQKALMLVCDGDEGTELPVLLFGVAVEHMGHVRVLAHNYAGANLGAASST